MASSITSRLGTTPNEAVKAPVVIDSTTNLTLSGEQTVNGVAVVAGDRVLVKAQTNAAENGIYVCKATAWVRATDWNQSNDVMNGCLVLETTNGDMYRAVYSGGFTLDTTEVTFTQIPYQNASGTVYDPAGAGAAATNVQAQLRYRPRPENYSTNANYVAAIASLSSGQHFAGSGAKIERLQDRAFIGEAAAKFSANASGLPDAGTSWLSSDSNGPAFLGVHAHLLATTYENTTSGSRYAIVGAAKTSALTNNGGIGVAGAVVNQKAGSPGWAFYGDVQAEVGDNFTYGIELACKNASGVNSVSNPYDFTQAGVLGIWLAAGGDNTYGPASTNPSNTAIVIGSNSSTWNAGISFLATGLTGTDGTAGSSTYATAIQLGRNHEISWIEPTNKTYGGKIRSRVTAQANRVMLDMLDNQIVFRGANENAMASITYTASSVNYLSLASSATTSAPILQAAGTDTDIDVRILPKGAGVLRVGTHSAIAAETVTGYITIKDSAGNLRKIAVVS